jgi:hypothetical protein
MDDLQLWLVDRTYTDKGLVTLVYATTDGERRFQRQRSVNALRQSGGVTAAITADPDDLQPVEDSATRQRDADEAARMADRHEPDETV